MERQHSARFYKRIRLISRNSFLLCLLLLVSFLAFSNPNVASGGNPTQVVFVGGSAQILSTYEVSSQITVQLQDSSGNPAPAGLLGVTINLSTNSSGGNGGSFTSDSNGNTKINQVFISVGATSASFYYYDLTVGSPVLTASGSGITSNSTQFSIYSPTLCFSSGASQTIPSYGLSLQVMVQLQDLDGDPISIPGSASSVKVNLATTSTGANGGVFCSDSGGNTAVSSVTISTSSNSAIFYYYDLTAGSPVLTATTATLSAATQFNVTQSKLAFAAGASQWLNPGTISAPITVQVEAIDGSSISMASRIAAFNVNLLSTSTGGNGGTFYSDSAGKHKMTSFQLSSGTTSDTFYYSDSTIGTPYITASGGQFTSASTQFTISSNPAPTPTPSPSPSPTPTQTPSPTPSPSPSPTPTPTPSSTPTPSPTPSPTQSPTPVPSPSPSLAPSPTPTASPTASPTPTPTPIPTETPTSSPAPTPTPNDTSTPTPISNPTPTSYPTPNPTPNQGQTHGQTSTPTPITTPQPTVETRSPLTAKFTYTSLQPSADLTFLFNASDSSSANSNISTYEWNFGDGNITSINTNTISHTYQNPGNYTVTLSTIDSSNLRASASETIIANARGVTAGGSSSGFGNVFYYLIPVGGLIAALSGFTVLKKRRQNNENGTSVRNGPKPPDFPLNGIGASLPDSYSIMITGEARAEKGLFCEQLAHYYLKQGKPVIYVTYDRFPAEIRNDMIAHGWDITSGEQEGCFTFVDAYSSIASKQSEEMHFVKQSFSLSELGMAMSSAQSKLRGQSSVVFLDSTGPLFTKVDSSKVVEFLQDRCAQIKGANSMFFFTVGAGIIQENLQRRLEEMVDCLTELRVSSEKGTMKRKMVVKKLRGSDINNVEMAVNFPDLKVEA